ncbi:hypothetical protein M758_9G131700 [Ceratodon purpureus]|uniref:Uncharacterized protein n=2 Tax=Ceratodon purpureus TaxID=3225 RepID=A0A8T0GSQ6_CERPU|nr:hypothetical protein KC19_9G061900 [Ceratodon purpureus]KAG0606322.1 hypothetical protein M758_9G131700 [Ceratodon purpureus]
MAAAAVTSSMASLSLRGSSFREFHGLVAQPSARPAMPSPAQGVMRKPLKVEAAGEGLAGKGAVRIRLVRFGRKKLPYYRIIIANSRSRRDGRFLEMVGHYNPMPDKNGEKDIKVNGERIKYWLSVGAQPSDTVRNILYKQGVMTPPNSPVPAPAAEA